jgi:hypothetical protein
MTLDVSTCYGTNTTVKELGDSVIKDQTLGKVAYPRTVKIRTDRQIHELNAINQATCQSPSNDLDNFDANNVRHDSDPPRGHPQNQTIGNLFAVSRRRVKSCDHTVRSPVLQNAESRMGSTTVRPGSQRC